jgi:hypothetical protein
MAPLLFFGLGILAGAFASKVREEVKPSAPPSPAQPARPALPPPQTKANAYGLLAADLAHSPTGGSSAPRAGVQSHPDYQWSYVVQSGTESPGSIAEKMLGAEQAWRYVELLTANPQKPIKGKVVTPDPNDDELNFVSLAVGERLVVPRTWNGWIDETGVPSGKSMVWPAPKGGM